MYQEDFVLKHVTAAAQVIARILGLKKTGQYQEARREIDQALQEFWGLSAGLAAELSVSDLLMLCRSGNLLDREKALLLATLLNQEADISAAEGQRIESRDVYIKALSIVLEALADADAEFGRKYLGLIEELTGKLGESGLHSSLAFELSKYYEVIGDLAKAKNYRVPPVR